MGRVSVLLNHTLTTVQKQIVWNKKEKQNLNWNLNARHLKKRLLGTGYPYPDGGIIAHRHVGPRRRLHRHRPPYPQYFTSLSVPDSTKALVPVIYRCIRGVFVCMCTYGRHIRACMCRRCLVAAFQRRFIAVTATSHAPHNNKVADNDSRCSFFGFLLRRG